uniref:Uncharacterized protein n=1 Tax=Branchiostoma floridae TaxID=7739 RepID=C3YCF7_BRAFL|eukprot:XP_002605984.1 hypothetical protein BRAFLDRAFT_126560 [Branchiostoma floridae]
MYEEAEPVRNPPSGAGIGQTSGPTGSQSPAVHQRNVATDKGKGRHGTSSHTYKEAERVYHTIKDQDLPPSVRGEGGQQESPKPGTEISGPPPCVRRGHEDQETPSHASDETQAARRYAAYTYAGLLTGYSMAMPFLFSTYRTYPGGASGRRGLCSLFRSHWSCLAAGIAMLLSLLTVGVWPLLLINKEEMKQLSATFDALKRDLDNISQLSTTIDALKHDQDDLRQLSIALKQDLGIERNRTATLERILHDMIKTPGRYPGI